MDNVKQRIETLLGELAGSLEDEFAALAARDLDALTAAVERKAALISELENEAGNYCRAGEQLPHDWPDLRALAARCADANRINGGAIALNRSLVSGLLDTLYSDQQPRTTTYDASGRIGPRDHARRVGYI